MALIIAEAGTNHNGSVERACEMVRVAAEAGADYIKFPTFIPHRLASSGSPKPAYQILATGGGPQVDMLNRLMLPQKAYFDIKLCCHQMGIGFMSSPMDEESLMFLVDECGVDSIKIASSELTDAPLLFQAGLMQKRIFLSTGMSTLEEIRLALSIIAFGSHLRRPPKNFIELDTTFEVHELAQILKNQVTLFHCTSEYPARLEDVNLRAIQTLKNTFDLPIGYSDHTKGYEVALAALALGAQTIEKGFTLDKELPGPEQALSLEPGELKSFVEAVRHVEKALGTGEKQPSSLEIENSMTMRKSLVAAAPIAVGEFFTGQNLTVKRPATGLSPWLYWDYLGNPTDQAYQVDELIVVKSLSTALGS